MYSKENTDDLQDEYMDTYESKMPLLYQTINENDEHHQPGYLQNGNGHPSLGTLPSTSLVPAETAKPSLAEVEEHSPSIDVAIPTKDSSPSGSHEDILKISGIPISQFVTRRNPKTAVSPAFIDEAHRQFSNPISYIGGPRLEPRNRNSVDSVLSLD